MFLTKKKDEYFMRKALGLAKRALEEEEVPVGSVIVYKDRIIAQSYNQTERLKDSTAHAEMIAITQAQSYLRSKWLKNCSIYVTIEPCLMCGVALGLCRIKEVVFGAYQPKLGGFGSLLDINELKVFPKIKVKSGILQDEAKYLIQSFFKKRRGNGLAGGEVKKPG